MLRQPHEISSFYNFQDETRVIAREQTAANYDITNFHNQNDEAYFL